MTVCSLLAWQPSDVSLPQKFSVLVSKLPGILGASQSRAVSQSETESFPKLFSTQKSPAVRLTRDKMFQGSLQRFSKPLSFVLKIHFSPLSAGEKDLLVKCERFYKAVTDGSAQGMHAPTRTHAHKFTNEKRTRARVGIRTLTKKEM